MNPILELEQDHIDWLLRNYKRAKERLIEYAEGIIVSCDEKELHEWVWCDYQPMPLGGSLSPAMKCRLCRKEVHTWNGLHGKGPGPKITRDELYGMRYPVHVRGEVP